VFTNVLHITMPTNKGRSVCKLLAFVYIQIYVIIVINNHSWYKRIGRLRAKCIYCRYLIAEMLLTESSVARYPDIRQTNSFVTLFRYIKIRLAGNDVQCETNKATLTNNCRLFRNSVININ
jgi:hypothetical protein